MITQLETQLDVTAYDTMTDEKVVCDEPIGGGLYMGHILGLAPSAIYGASNTLNGAWTGTSKSGTRQTIIAAGDPSANQLLLDIMTGRVISPSSQTVYFNYQLYARLFHQPQQWVIKLNGAPNTGAYLEVYDQLLVRPARYSHYQLNMPISTTHTDVSLRLTNVTSGESSVFGPSGAAYSYSGALGAALLFARGDRLKLEVTAPEASAFVDPEIVLIEG